MSFLYSRALVAACSQATCSASLLSAQSSTTSTVSGYWSSDKTMESSRRSPSGMTFERLTAYRGAELLTSYLEAFPARPSALPLLDATTLKTFGRRCAGSWQMSLPGLSSPKTSLSEQSKKPDATSFAWVTKSECFPCPRQTWVLTTFGNATGYLHTPTTKANYCADSMQKWPAAREFRRVFGRPSPAIHEWMMGWPEGWTDTAPLETAKWQQWLTQHSLSSLPALKEAA